jgi:hypothetical protein
MERIGNGLRAAHGAAVAAWALTMAGSASASLSLDAPRIAELRVDQQGADTDEYFELAGTPGASLTGCWFLAIGDSATDPGGVVEMAVDLSSWSIGANGRFLAHESTFGTTVLGGRALAADPLCTNATIGTGDSLNFENSDNVTYLLVRGFSGTLGMDLDAANAGTLDRTPWSDLIDSVAFVSTVSTDPVYSDVRVGPVALTSTGGMPPHAWLDGSGWHVGEYASFVHDTPGSAPPELPAPGAGATLALAASAGRMRRRRG